MNSYIEYRTTYQKKPVKIKAWQFSMKNKLKGFERQGGPYTNVRINDYDVKLDERGFYLEIDTLEGVMRADEGDFIITGVAGEIYPCKEDIFWKTYTVPDEGNRGVSINMAGGKVDGSLSIGNIIVTGDGNRMG